MGTSSDPTIGWLRFGQPAVAWIIVKIWSQTEGHPQAGMETDYFQRPAPQEIA
jgi:hypothetical protein